MSANRILRGALDALSAHLAILDEQGIIIAVNAAWKRYAIENAFGGEGLGLGDNYLDVCQAAHGPCSEEASAVASGIRAVMTGKSEEFYLEYPCDGPLDSRWFAVRAARLCDEGSIRVIVAHENITVRKRAELALLESEEKYRALIETTGTGFAILDSQGIVVDANDEFIRLTGCQGREEVLGHSVVEWTAVDQRASCVAAFRQCLEQGQVRGLEVDYTGGDGRITSVVVNATVVQTRQGERVMTLCRDITHRRQAMSDLRKLSRAVEQSPVSVVITDRGGLIEYVNPKFFALTGYSLEEVRGQNPRMLKSGKMSPETYRGMWATLAEGEEWHGEFHNRKKSGELFWESASISPVRDERGEITHFVAVKEDITERKRIEEELLWKTALFEAQTDSTLDGILLVDCFGKVVLKNEPFTAIFPIPDSLSAVLNDTLLLTHALSLVKDPQTFADRVAHLYAHPDETGRDEIELVDGRVLDRYSAPVRDKTGRHYGRLWTFRDMTERRLAAEVLREQLLLRERLSKIAASAPGIIYSFRLRPDGSTCFPYASPTIDDFLGLRAEDVLDDASPLVDLIHPDDQARVYASVAESARTLLPNRMEFRVRHPVKGLFWVECQSTPEREADGGILWHGYMSNISGRKTAEEALQESERRFAGAFEFAPIGVALVSPDGHWLKVNRVLCDVVGYSEAELLTRTLMDITHPEDLAESVENMSRLLLGKTHSYQIEKRYIHAHGHLIHVSANVSLVRDGQGQPHYFITQIQDLTDRKLAARQLAEHEEREERSRRALKHERELNLIKSRFVSVVSHEFRTPLGIVKTAAHLLGHYLERMTAEERSAQLHEIEHAVRRMTEMMEDLLLHGKFEAGKMACNPARADMAALCRQMVLNAGDFPGAMCLVDSAVDPAAREACVDEKIVRHIVGNLLSNAVKYSVDRSPVRLEMKRVVWDDSFGVNPAPACDGFLQILVRDSGLGIPAADREKIFQTFHRASNVGQRPGTGMGLAIVKQYVDLHRGAIRLESEEGRGTTVEVWLPINLRLAQQSPPNREDLWAEIEAVAKNTLHHEENPNH